MATGVGERTIASPPPSGGPAQPVGVPAQPTGGTAQPTGGTAQPTGDTAQPTGDTAQHARDSAQPSEGSGQPAADWTRLILDVPDFPKPGIAFKDITPLLADPTAYGDVVQLLTALAPDDVDLVVGMEARGFLFAAPLALRLGVGFAPIRKPGKLPRATVSASYTLEYRSETLTMHADAVRAGQRVLIVDDVLATGGTAHATAELVAAQGGSVAAVVVLIELGYLAGRAALREAGLADVRALLRLEA